MKEKAFIVFAAFALVTTAQAQMVVSVPTVDALFGTSIANQYAEKMQMVDEFYQQYDMLMNTYQNIENQYRQIQQAVERAKSIDWENIKFDGDFDIRDDLRNANKRINRLLNQARSIRDALTTSVINVPGGGSYSIADLCGVGADGSKDLFTAAADVAGYMEQKMQNMADAAAGKLTDEQRMAISAKYGISPRNFWFVKQTEAQLQQAIGNAIGYAQDATEKMTEDEELLRKNSLIVEGALNTKDSNGNMTEGAAASATVTLLHSMSTQLSDLKGVLRQGIGLSAWQMQEDMRVKEAAAQSAADEYSAQKFTSGKVPGSFATKSESLR